LNEEVVELVAEGAVNSKAAQITRVDEDADAIGTRARIGAVIGRVTKVGATGGCGDVARPGKDDALVDCAVSTFDAKTSSSQTISMRMNRAYGHSCYATHTALFAPLYPLLVPSTTVPSEQYAFPAVGAGWTVVVVVEVWVVVVDVVV
jgi:hypothetical protein